MRDRRTARLNPTSPPPPPAGVVFLFLLEFAATMLCLRSQLLFTNAASLRILASLAYIEANFVLSLVKSASNGIISPRFTSQGQSMVEFDQIDFGVIGCVERVLLGDAVTH